MIKQNLCTWISDFKAENYNNEDKICPIENIYRFLKCKLKRSNIIKNIEHKIQMNCFIKKYFMYESGSKNVF